jgi:hypothetical protein
MAMVRCDGGVRSMSRTPRGSCSLLATAACSSDDTATPQSAADQPRTIRIGAIVPMEGQSASLGKSFLEAVRVSIDTLGDTKNRYELRVEDGGTTMACGYIFERT